MTEGHKTTAEPDPYFEGLEAVATAAQALLESGIWHHRNSMPTEAGNRGLNYFSVQARFADALTDALLRVSRIPDASSYEDWT